MVELIDLAAAKTTMGGVRISYTGAMTDLIVNGGLEDSGVGYSANLPLTTASPSSNESKATLAELGLMTGPADPMMHFPAGTTFTPYTVLRNVSSSPVIATPTIWWMANGSAKSFRLSQLSVQPYQTQMLDMPALLTQAGLINFSGTLQLALQVQGDTGGLLVAGGSVDQSNTYVFEVAPHGVLESASKELSYWKVANGDDTMVTVWNPADEAQDFTFEIAFAGGRYGYPIHLEARASRTFNMSDIVESGIPDAADNVIPAGVSEGSAKILGMHADNEHIIVAMDAGTYNVRKATCGSPFCQSCNGVTSFSEAASSFSVAVSGHLQQTLYDTWNTGSQYNENSYSSWTSSASSVATVGTMGSGTPGLVAGVGGGSSTIAARYNAANQPQYTAYFCQQSQWSCPSYYASGGGTSSANILYPDHSIILSTFRNQATPNAYVACAAGYSGWDRKLSLQIVSSNGTYLTQDGVVLGEVVSPQTPNVFGINTVQTGSTTTATAGAYTDEFYLCTNQCPAQTGEADALQTITYGSLPMTHANSIRYFCNKVLFNNN